MTLKTQQGEAPGDPLHDDAYLRGIALGWPVDSGRYRTLMRIADRIEAMSRQEPDCWAVLTPNGSKLVPPDEAKGRKDAYPLYATPSPSPAVREALAELVSMYDSPDARTPEWFERYKGVWAAARSALSAPSVPPVEAQSEPRPEWNSPDHMEWIADKIVNGGDYAKEAAMVLRHLAGVHRAPPTEFCWLVELFEPHGGNSLGFYHTGFTDLGGYSRTTKSPHEARRYTKPDAEAIAAKLFSKAGVWRAIEHGFG